MHDDQNSNDTRNSGGRAPEYDAFSVRDRGPDKSASWNRIGAAWKHRDGKGYDLALDAVPVDGRVTLREQRREEFKQERQGQQNNQSRQQERGR